VTEPEADANPIRDYAGILARELLAPEEDSSWPHESTRVEAVVYEDEEPRVATNGVAPQAPKQGVFARFLRWVDHIRTGSESSDRLPTAPHGPGL
jgi:hypothetical protein